MNSLFLQPQKLSAEQFKILEDEFRTLLSSQVDRDALFASLETFFHTSNTGQDYMWRHDYFRWYTEIFWRKINKASHDDFVDIAYGRQVPMAILLGFDVLSTLFFYLDDETIEIDAMQSFYTRVQNAFFNSSVIVGVWQGKQVTLKELCEEVKLANRPTATSLEWANLFSKTETMLLPKNDSIYDAVIGVNPEDAATKLMDVINFFLGVKPENIAYVVDAFMNPELEGKQRAPTQLVTADTTEAEEDEPAEDETVTDSGIKLTHAQIKATLEADFPKDKSGQFVDTEGVLNKLASYAEEYNDAMILDLYYYNEADGKFHWNEDLLNS